MKRMCEDCPEELAPNARESTTRCPSCSSSKRYWDGKRPRERLQRREKLSIYQQRNESWFDKDGKPR